MNLRALGWLLAGIGLLPAAPSRADDGETHKPGVVGIEASDAGLRRTGSGVVVQVDPTGVYVLTAAHVVVPADVPPRVTFYADRTRSHPAELVQAQGDNPNGLALLRVRGAAVDGLQALRLDAAESGYAGEAALAIGFPANAGLAWAVTRGAMVGQKGTELVFSGALHEGDSGGPVIVNGLVVGVVSRVLGTQAFVVPAPIARFFLRGSGLDLAQLVQAGRAAPAADAWPPLGGARWIRFRVSAVGGLPPIPDQLGEPDFVLWADADNGQRLFDDEITGERPTAGAVLGPAVLDGARAVVFQLIEDDSGLFGRSHEVITSPVSVPLGAFARSNRVRLPIDPKLFETYRQLDRTQTAVTLSFQLEHFDPDGDSGDDRRPEAPQDVVAGEILRGSVDFDAGDATDHLRLSGTPGSGTVALLWLHTNHMASLAPPAAGAAPAVITLQRESVQGRAQELLQVLRSPQERLPLQLQATAPGAHTDYHLFVLAGADGVRGHLDHLAALLRSPWTQDGRAGQGWRPQALARGIAALRRHFQVPIERQVEVLEAGLQPEADEPPLAFVEEVVAAELPEHARAVDERRAALQRLPALLAVMRAEKGQAFADADLERALADPQESLVVRAIAVVGRSNRPDYAARVLPPLLMDPRPPVSNAARDLLQKLRWRP